MRERRLGKAFYGVTGPYKAPQGLITLYRALQRPYEEPSKDCIKAPYNGPVFIRLFIAFDGQTALQALLEYGLMKALYKAHLPNCSKKTDCRNMNYSVMI